jgi:hypothetical protein
VTATLGRHETASAAAPGRAARRRGATTPTTMRSLLAALILLSLAWGAFGGWVASVHSSAAGAVGAVDERLSQEARQMYQSIADADTTITAALLTSAQPPLAPLQRYRGDIATVAAEMPQLRAAGGSQEITAALAALSGGLPVYTDDVAKAQSAYAFGYPLTGGSFLQVASEEAHLVLLPQAKTVFTQENQALDAASSQATGLPLVVVALLLAIVTGIVLYRAQRWLTRRTKRVFSVPLVFASLLLAISASWLAAGFLAARSALDNGIDRGSRPAQNLAQASIDVRQVRGDAVLNVISRSGSTSFVDDFQAKKEAIGPGPGTLLTEAAAAQGTEGAGASLVVAAEREATGWYAANSNVYRLGSASDYAAERDLVVGTGTGSSASGYSALESDINAAIDADEKVFTSAATQGSSALDPLEPMVIVAAILMAIGCGWGLSRRLAEYR